MYYVYTNYDVITDANGNVKERLSFDAWGNRRNPNNWAQAEAATTAHVFSRGFTGHEHLDYFGIINMNGRLYDPLIARFFSPDPYTQEGTQGLNRYSYCLNNPLMYTDPSGENPFFIALGVSAAINVLVKAGTGQINSIWDFLSAVGNGAFIGAAGYGAGALVGGIVGTAGVVGGALTGAAAGMAGGFAGSVADTWMSGAGFNGGLRSAAIGGLIGAAFGGLMGGLLAIEQGGDFWTGGMTHEYIIGNDGSSQIVSNYNGSDAAKRNDEFLKIRIEEEFNVSEGQYNIKEISTQVTKEGYSVRTDGYYSNSKGDIIGGVAYTKYGKTFINISPKVTNSHISYFREVAGHELVHAYHYYTFKGNFKKWNNLEWNNRIVGERTELIAHKYSNWVRNGYSINPSVYFSGDPIPWFPFMRF